MCIYIYLYIYIDIDKVTTVHPPKSGHPMGHPLSEFWIFSKFGVYIFFRWKNIFLQKNKYIYIYKEPPTITK